MRIKHSKYRNTGILFELLVRQITADTLRGNDSACVNLLKKYFVNTELGKEYKLYESVLKSKSLNETKANILLSTLLESSKKLNRSILRNEKYNLIKEIKSNYNLNEFFGTKIKNYKQLASLYTLIESYNSKNFPDSNQIVDNKITILEFLVKNQLVEVSKDQLLEEFTAYDKDLRSLTYQVLLEKFNDKYENLTKGQKQVLKEFIESIDSTPKLKEFYNSKINSLKKELKETISSITDQATQIKIVEVTKYLTELDKKDKINTDNLVDLLQYYELINEIKLSTNVQS